MDPTDRVRRRVLFVDDEVRVTQNLRALLRKLPLEIHTAASAEEGLSFLADTPVDIVVSDERMPGMPGSKFLAEVRRRHPDTMRIILTGQASLEATIEAINEGGIFRFLSKPCETNELIATLEEAVAALECQRAAHEEPEERTSAPRDTRHRSFQEALAGCWMAYQPIVSASSREVVGYEALLRPEHADFPGPSELIHAAEALGRIWDFELHVSDLLADQLDAMPPGPSLMVNLHPEAMNEPELFEGDYLLHRHAERIVLEITERAPLEAIPDCAAKIAFLREQGYRIALDDLGAGYSGLVNFADLKPDIVKFDRALVSHVDERPISSRLIASMLRVCREMGVLAVGEGIERIEERDHLAELGCDLLQGFAIAMPGKPFPEPVWPTAGTDGEAGG